MTTCIVVDDEREVVEVFTEFLETIGVKILARGFDGKQAEELYKKHKPDVVFLDIMMPQYDGFYALKKIKAFDPDSKIIIVTADYTQETQKNLHDYTEVSVVYKPFSLDQISKVLAYEFGVVA